ncbi:MAG: NAD(P)H-dependent oxidoreductase subunit E [Mariprofundaceae bacterium]
MSESEMNPQFSQASLDEIAGLVSRYPAAQSALLPVLHMAQGEFGYLSMPVQQLVADTLGLRLMQVREVVTFYTMFREQPCGKYLLEVCTTAGCMLSGADALLEHVCNTLAIKPGETTADGLFTVTEVECAGACSGAPVVQINNRYHEKVDAVHLDTFVGEKRAEAEGAR